MTELTYFLLKMGFLALMWFFVFAVVMAIRSDLFGPKVRILSRPGKNKRKVAAAAQAAPAVTAPSEAPTSTIPTPTGEPDSLSSLVRQQSGPVIATTETASRLTLTAGPRAGHEFMLGTDPITVGRSTESGLVLRDDYTSNNHARIFLRAGTWMLEDQGSTNGTLMAGERVSNPTPIPLDTPINIGTSVLELRG